VPDQDAHVAGDLDGSLEPGCHGIGDARRYLVMLWRWFTREELAEWIDASWDFVRQIVPLLFAGAFMYFATCTEVPILEDLLGSGMGRGPALALLLAGPALSLPSIVVIRSVIGTEKTIVYSVLVVIMATLCGMVYGALQT
jgi:uncharacterized membrane protein YraQ (UPF0718 family)